MQRLVQIYRSASQQEMYLYVDKANGLVDIPEPLLARFGEPQPVMVLLLTPERKLARVDAAEVLGKIQEQGFFLQMPPTMAELLSRDGSRE
jgi:uncharacterized protein YcgL (UPF0745 family)